MRSLSSYRSVQFGPNHLILLVDSLDPVCFIPCNCESTHNRANLYCNWSGCNQFTSFCVFETNGQPYRRISGVCSAWNMQASYDNVHAHVWITAAGLGLGPLPVPVTCRSGVVISIIIIAWLPTCSSSQLLMRALHVTQPTQVVSKC